MISANSVSRSLLRVTLFLLPPIIVAAAVPQVVRAWGSWASTATSDDEVIYACYVPSSGTIYRIKATNPEETCKSDQHVEFHWNVQGPAGADGTDGADGADGADGTDGVSGYVVMEQEYELTDAGLGEILSCPTGKKVLGGGYFVADVSGASRRPHLNRPINLGGGTWGWAVTVVGGGDGTVGSVTIFAICADVSP